MTTTTTLVSPLRYDSSHDVRMRLMGTFIKIDDEPYYVLRTFDDLSMSVVPLSELTVSAMVDGLSNKSIQIHSSDVRIDLSSIPIGYLPDTKIATYFYRTPRNSQRQGLVLENLGSFTLKKNGEQWGGGLGLKGNEDLKDLYKMIQNKFIGFQECMKLLDNKDVHSVPFDRDWAVSRLKRGFGIYHKTIPVALFDPDKSKILFRSGGLTKTRLSKLNHLLYRDSFFNQYSITEA